MWYITSGLSTCIDHRLVSTAVAAWCSVTVLPFDGFLSDHRSVTLALPAIFDQDPTMERPRVLFSLKGPNAAEKKADFARAVDVEWSQSPHPNAHPGILRADLSCIIQKCAKEIFAVRLSGTSTPFAIVRMQKLRNHLMSGGPFWWANPVTVTRVARAKARVSALWDLHLAAQRPGLKLDRSTPPTRAHNVAVYQKHFDPTGEPRYKVNIDVHPALRPAVVLDQSRSRNSAPAISFSLDEVKQITRWMPTPMLRPVVTVRLSKGLLARTKSSSPHMSQIA